MPARAIFYFSKWPGCNHCVPLSLQTTSSTIADCESVVVLFSWWIPGRCFTQGQLVSEMQTTKSRMHLWKERTTRDKSRAPVNHCALRLCMVSSFSRCDVLHASQWWSAHAQRPPAKIHQPSAPLFSQSTCAILFIETDSLKKADIALLKPLLIVFLRGNHKMMTDWRIQTHHKPAQPTTITIWLLTPPDHH